MAELVDGLLSIDEVTAMIEREIANREFRHLSSTKQDDSDLFCDAYKRYMYKCIDSSMKNPKNITVGVDNYIKIDAYSLFQLEMVNSLGKTKRCGMHFVHYGNYTSDRRWRIRTPYSLKRNPFKEIQQEIYEKNGLILLDMSDPS